MIVRGVSVISRCDVPYELDGMAKCIEVFPSGEVLALVTEVSCDSKAGCCFTIQARTFCERIAEEIGRCFEEAAIREFDGHNGIYVEPCGVQVAPWWLEADELWEDDDTL